MVKNNIKSIHQACAILVILWAICPPLQYGVAIRTAVCFCAVLWLFYAWIKCIAQKMRCRGIFFAAITFSIFMLVARYVTSRASFLEVIVKCLHTFIFLLILCIGNYYLETKPLFLIKTSYVVVLLSCVFAVITFCFCLSNPNVARTMVHNPEIARYYAIRGVGGYGLTFSCVFYCLALLYIQNFLKARWRLLSCGLLFIMTLMIFEASFFIAFLLLLLCYLLFFTKVFTQANGRKTFWVTLFWTFLGLVVVKYVLSVYGEKLIEMMSTSPYALKTKDIVYTFNGLEGMGKVEGRSMRYLASFVGVLKYFFVGAVFFGKAAELGNHSQLIDILATYGVFISGFYFYALHKGICAIKELIPEGGFFYTFYFLIILLGFLDNYTSEFAIPFFIVIPAVAVYRHNVTKA